MQFVLFQAWVAFWKVIFDKLFRLFIHPTCSTERNRWAENRERLVKLGNSESLDLIDHSMFTLVLDDFAYLEPGDCCKQHIAGPAQNRWPDKSFSVVMGMSHYMWVINYKNLSGHDGKAGVVFEHAWGDGAAVLHFMNSVNDQVRLLLDEFRDQFINKIQFQTHWL